MIRRTISVVLGGLLASTAASPASAILVSGDPPVPINSSFVFTGICTDCVRGVEAETPVSGTLVLSGYTLGDRITRTNFVSWTYNGSAVLAAYTINNSDVQSGMGFVSGSIGQPVPGPQQFFVQGADRFFLSSTNGGWNTGIGTLDFDQGFAGSYNAAVLNAGVPEPATWGLMLAGFGLVGAAARYRRRGSGVSFA